MYPTANLFYVVIVLVQYPLHLTKEFPQNIVSLSRHCCSLKKLSPVSPPDNFGLVSSGPAKRGAPLLCVFFFFVDEGGPELAGVLGICSQYLDKY